MTMKLDAYSFQARLQPALITILPIGLAALSLFPLEAIWKAGLGTLLALAGFSYLLAQLSRDRGKSIERSLWEGWGGKPTTQLLRHSRVENNKITLERRHRKLATLIETQFPTALEEKANPAHADSIYDSGVDYLRDKTRDTTIPQNQLIFSELTSYGFRRNLLAMKPAGIACSALATVATTILGTVNYATDKNEPLPWICSLICGLILVWWLLRIKPDWVRITAFAYAARLLESTERL